VLLLLWLLVLWLLMLHLHLWRLWQLRRRWQGLRFLLVTACRPCLLLMRLCLLLQLRLRLLRRLRL